MDTCEKGGAPALCSAGHKQPTWRGQRGLMRGWQWPLADTYLEREIALILLFIHTSAYRLIGMEGLAGPKLYSLQSGNKSNPCLSLVINGAEVLCCLCGGAAANHELWMK